MFYALLQIDYFRSKRSIYCLSIMYIDSCLFVFILFFLLALFVLFVIILYTVYCVYFVLCAVLHEGNKGYIAYYFHSFFLSDDQLTSYKNEIPWLRTRQEGITLIRHQVFLINSMTGRTKAILVAVLCVACFVAI